MHEATEAIPSLDRRISRCPAPEDTRVIWLRSFKHGHVRSLYGWHRRRACLWS
jgi:hypothetical protein